MIIVVDIDVINQKSFCCLNTTDSEMNISVHHFVYRCFLRMRDV